MLGGPDQVPHGRCFPTRFESGQAEEKATISHPGVNTAGLVAAQAPRGSQGGASLAFLLQTPAQQGFHLVKPAGGEKARGGHCPHLPKGQRGGGRAVPK